MNTFVKQPYLAAESVGGTASDDLAGIPVTFLLDRLETNLDVLGKLIANRSTDELQQAAQDGEWGVVEILAHLQEWEEITHERVWRILDEDCPELEEYDDSFWAIDHDYGTRNGHEVFASTMELRRELLERLRALVPESWERTAILADRGEIDLAWLMRNLARHDEKNIARTREALG